MSAPAALIVTCQLRAGQEEVFTGWPVTHNERVVTIPLAVRGFGWWLFLKKESPPWTTTAGVALLLALFAIEVALFWHQRP